MSDETPDIRELRAGFSRWSRYVRTWVALRTAATGAAAGAAVGAGATAALWALRYDSLRLLGFSALIVGALGGLVWASRRRKDDEAVALFLDERLSSNESVTTALALTKADEEARAAREAVVQEALRAIRAATKERVRPRVLRRHHALLPLALAATLALCLVPLPPAEALPPPPPGAEIVKATNIAGLEKVIALESLAGRDPADQERLKRLAEEAKKLREALREGMEKRQALSALAKLRDEVREEKLSLGDGDPRQGLESALSELGKSDDLGEAQRALGDRDLTALDEAMQKLANRMEQEGRERAQKILEDAQKAAEKAGAKGLSQSLAEQKKLLAQRGSQNDRLKELAKAMGEGLSQEAKDALSELGQSGDPEAQKKLAEAMNKALEGLSEEERKKVAEALKDAAERAAEGGGEGAEADAEAMRDWAEELSSEEGQKQLAEQLKQLAKGQKSGDAQRQDGLGEAEKGLGEAESSLGGVPMPVPGDGSGNGSPGGNGANQPGNNPGTPGPSRGGGPGNHDGQTNAVDGDGVKAKANSKMNPGAPMPGVVAGRTTGRVGETANVRGEGAIGEVGAKEVDAVDKSQVPAEYREQVGRYFEAR